MAATKINSNHVNGEASRQEIQAAIAEAVELRAIHAAFMQGPTHPRLFSSSRPPPPQLAALDYPVFTPSYEEEPLPAYRQLQLESRPLSDGMDDQYGLVLDSRSGTLQSEYTREDGSSRKFLPPGLASLDSHYHTFLADQDTRSATSSCTNNITVLQSSPAAEVLRSRRRNSLGEFKSVSSCNKSKHGANDADSISCSSNGKHSNIVVPLTDSHMAVQPQPKSKGVMFSWLKPRLKKKPKGERSPLRAESEEVSQILKDFGVLSVETLKKQLIEANQKRDAALAEVVEMKPLFEDLRKKLEHLEGYCEDLKRALRQAVQVNGSNHHQQQQEDKLGSLLKRGKLVDGNGADNLMPVGEEAMVEGFLQIVTEARLSVKHFCKMLIRQVQEKDDQLMNNLNSLLQPYKLFLSSKYSKAVLYHLEAIVNQALYQDFENCVFQKNGPPKLLDPHQDRQAQFSSFAALRNLSWNEVTKKGTKYYSEEFSKFCDQKMNCIISTLNWIRPWPEQLLQSFFVATKCIWLVHLLAFSFYPPLTILRVEENRRFDPHYMEDILVDKYRAQQVSSRVKIMVMPGFYVHDKILRCKVLCRYKALA